MTETLPGGGFCDARHLLRLRHKAPWLVIGDDLPVYEKNIG